MNEWRKRTVWRGLGLGMMLSLCDLGFRNVWTNESATPSLPFRYDAKGRRDPFEPLVKDGRLVPALTDAFDVHGDKPLLRGILWDAGGGSLALLNDGEYKRGDMVDGYKVVEIHRDAVVLVSGGNRTVLQISFESPSSSAKGHNGR